MTNKDEFLSRGNAYIYLKTLVSKSKDFKGDVMQVRKRYGIRTKIDKDDGTIEGGLRVAAQLERRIEKRSAKSAGKLPDFTKKPEFQAMCEKYFIPKYFWKGLNYFICTGNSERLISDKIKVVASSTNAPKPLEKGFLIPHTLIYVPFNVGRTEFNNIWKEIRTMQTMAIPFLRGVHIWNDGKTFDKALATYHLYMQGFKGRKYREKLAELGYIGRPNQLVDSGEPSKWRKQIDRQINSLKHWERL